jgi:hypothetical protein
MSNPSSNIYFAVSPCYKEEPAVIPQKKVINRMDKTGCAAFLLYLCCCVSPIND